MDKIKSLWADFTKRHPALSQFLIFFYSKQWSNCPADDFDACYESRIR